MSIILKGIDLPQTLYTDIRIYWDGRIKKIIGENTMISYKNTQAIQIPKGHGRLIDVNKLYPSTLEKLEYGGSDGRMIYRKKFQAYTEKDIENAPTILGMEK